MSALLQQLSERGVTNEDLEKAASVHLFQKVASANDIDLSQLVETDKVALYEQFVGETLPTMLGKEASDDDGDVAQKIASLSEDDVISLFEKQAAHEGFTAEDLQNAEDEKLASAYGHFREEILPIMAANDWAPVDVEEKTAAAEEAAAEAAPEADKVAEATAKLAEADLLGRQMAHSFHDELNKLGAAAEDKGDKEASSAAVAAKLRAAGDAAKATSKQKKLMAAGIAGTAGGAATGYAAGKKASSPVFEAAAMQKAAEILEANGIDPQTGETKEASIDEAINARAVELLEAAGYTFEG